MRRIIQLFITVVCVCCLWWTATPLPAWTADATPLAPHIDRQVLLLRHSVRAPTQDAATLAQWSAKAWPDWGVAPGELTPRGYALARDMGAYLRWLFNLQVLVADRTSNSTRIYIRADLDQRTRATAEGLAKGMSPHGNIYFTVTSHAVDGLFNPVKAGLSHYDTAAVSQQITAADIQALHSRLSAPLAAVSGLTGPLDAALCAKSSTPAPCTVATLPTMLELKGATHTPAIKGGLGIASTLAEIFLLESSQWPQALPAWGELTEQRLPEVLDLHTTVFNTLYRAPAVASARGSMMLNAIAYSLTASQSPPVTVFVGHDTTIATVAALLGAHWSGAGYPPDATPPLSGLLFSRSMDSKGTPRIQLHVLLPAMTDLHRARPNAMRPIQVRAELPDAVRQSLDTPMQFLQMVHQRAPISPQAQRYLQHTLP